MASTTFDNLCRNGIVVADRRIVGCGDGALTAQIAASASKGQILGLDASQSFISTAQNTRTTPNCTFKLQDCTHIDEDTEAVDGSWDKVFSNAAMHWILRNPDTRVNFFHNIYRALKPGGTFVFEQGGAGNVAEVQSAAIAALTHSGLTLEQARDACPWYFPTVDWMSATLRRAGFEVETCELEYRPTKLTADTKDGSGGLEGWAKLFCAQYLEKVDEGKRAAVLKEICEILDAVVAREEDGTKYLGYVRLRAVARKK